MLQPGGEVSVKIRIHLREYVGTYGVLMPVHAAEEIPNATHRALVRGWSICSYSRHNFIKGPSVSVLSTLR